MDFPLLYRFAIKGMTLFLRFIPVLKRKWHFTKNGHALLAVSDFRQAPAKNLRFFGFPASLSLLDKGYDVVSTIHSGFETQMAFEGRVQRARFSAVLVLKLKLLRRADCELFRLHRRVLRRRGTRLLFSLADSLLRRLLSLRAHPPHQAVHRRHLR